MCTTRSERTSAFGLYTNPRTYELGVHTVLTHKTTFIHIRLLTLPEKIPVYTQIAIVDFNKTTFACRKKGDAVQATVRMMMMMRGKIFITHKHTS